MSESPHPWARFLAVAVQWMLDGGTAYTRATPTEQVLLISNAEQVMWISLETLPARGQAPTSGQP